MIDQNLLLPEEEFSAAEQELLLKKADITETSDLLKWHFDAIQLGHARCKALQSKISDWARKFNLFEPWIGDVALRTMIGWHHGVDKDGEWLTYWSSFPHALTEEDRMFKMDIPEAWDPSMTSEKDARATIRKKFNQELNKFLARGIPLAKKEGYERVKVRPTELSKHLGWLVRYQVVGETYIAIGKSLGAKASDEPMEPGERKPDDERHRKTASNGVGKAAEAIGLALRDPDKGAIGPSQNS